MTNHKSGYIKIAKFGETPVLMHRSFLIGSIFVAIIFRAEIGEVFYVCSAYAVLIIVHEIGHAIAAYIFGLKVISIELSGIGGICRTEIPKSRLAAFIYASGGIIAQMLLLVVVGTHIHYNGWPSTVVGSSLAFVFTAINSLLVIINLIPQKARRETYGSDGHLIWKLIQQLILRKPYGYPDTSATFHPRTNLLNTHGFELEGFEVGIEILNDNSTTMEFVVGALTKHLKIPHKKAVEMMLTIHNKGGMLIPLKSYAVAQEIASAISDEAKREGYKLVCRPVHAQEG